MDSLFGDAGSALSTIGGYARKVTDAASHRRMAPWLALALAPDAKSQFRGMMSGIEYNDRANFREQEADRIQGNADRQFGLQEERFGLLRDQYADQKAAREAEEEREARANAFLAQATGGKYTPEQVGFLRTSPTGRKVLESGLGMGGADNDYQRKIDNIRQSDLTPEQKEVAINRLVGGSAGMSLRTNPDGSVEFSQGGPAGLTKSNQTAAERRVMSGQRMMAQLDDIERSFRPEYLTYVGAAKGAAGRVLDKSGMSDEDLSKFNAERASFVQKLRRVFNDYRRDITGAAASVREMADLEKAMINAQMGPAEFVAAMASLRESIAVDMAIHQQMAADGLTPDRKDSPEFIAEYQRRRSGANLEAASAAAGAAMEVGQSVQPTDGVSIRRLK